MKTNMIDKQQIAKYSLGQIIKHSKFDYRGVIFDVDAEFSGTEEWYENVAKSRPHKDKPWYHIIVDDSDTTTYVAERHLQIEDDLSAIQHPFLHVYFEAFKHGRYSLFTKQSQ